MPNNVSTVLYNYTLNRILETLSNKNKNSSGRNSRLKLRSNRQQYIFPTKDRNVIFFLRMFDRLTELVLREKYNYK